MTPDARDVAMTPEQENTWYYFTVDGMQFRHKPALEHLLHYGTEYLERCPGCGAEHWTPINLEDVPPALREALAAYERERTQWEATHPEEPNDPDRP